MTHLVYLRAARARRQDLQFLALLDIFKSSWWRRCWVIQELVVSKLPKIVWGKCALSWYNFKTIPHVLHFASRLLACEIRSGNPNIKPVHTEFARSMFTQSANDMRILLAVWNYWQMTLRDALCITRTLESTDARDRVFSVGIVKKECDIQPDYQSSTKPEKVYHTATIRTILCDQSLNILFDREPRSSFIDHPLPSWVPDMSKPLQGVGLPAGIFNSNFAPPQTCKETTTWPSLQMMNQNES